MAHRFNNITSAVCITILYAYVLRKLYAKADGASSQVRSSVKETRDYFATSFENKIFCFVQARQGHIGVMERSVTVKCAILCGFVGLSAYSYVIIPNFKPPLWAYVVVHVLWQMLHGE